MNISSMVDFIINHFKVTIDSIEFYWTWML